MLCVCYCVCSYDFPSNQLLQTALGIRWCSVQGTLAFGRSAKPSPFPYLLSSNLPEPPGLVHGLLCMEGTFAGNLCLEPPAEEGKAHGLVFYGPHSKNGFCVSKGLFFKK